MILFQQRVFTTKTIIIASPKTKSTPACRNKSMQIQPPSHKSPNAQNPARREPCPTWAGTLIPTCSGVRPSTAIATMQISPSSLMTRPSISTLEQCKGDASLDTRASEKERQKQVGTRRSRGSFGTGWPEFRVIVAPVCLYVRECGDWSLAVACLRFHVDRVLSELWKQSVVWIY